MKVIENVGKGTINNPLRLTLQDRWMKEGQILFISQQGCTGGWRSVEMLKEDVPRLIEALQEIEVNGEIWTVMQKLKGPRL